MKYFFQLDNEQYWLYLSWDAVTLKDYIAYQALTTPGNAKELAQYDLDVLSIMSNVPSDVITKLSRKQIAGLTGVFYQALKDKPLIPAPIDSFEYEGVLYKCPLSKVALDGTVIPMYELTTEEYIDAVRLMESHEGAKEAPVDKLPAILSILFRPEGEKYDESLAFERAKLFQYLPASTALSAYFFLWIRLILLIGSSQGFERLADLKDMSESIQRS